MGQYQVGQLGLLGKPGHLFGGAVLWPGADPVGHVLGVGSLVNQYMAAVAGVSQQRRVVIVTSNDQAARNSPQPGPASIPSFFSLSCISCRSRLRSVKT